MQKVCFDSGIFGIFFGKEVTIPNTDKKKKFYKFLKDLYPIIMKYMFIHQKKK